MEELLEQLKDTLKIEIDAALAAPDLFHFDHALMYLQDKVAKVQASASYVRSLESNKQQTM